MIDVMFYEVFAEEERLLKSFLPKKIKARYTSKTIQEAKHNKPPAHLICIRTQSKIPPAWSNDIDGIFTRSQGYDHLLAYKKLTNTKSKLGHLPSYCSRSVAEQAIMLMFNLFRQTKKQSRQFSGFNRDGLTGIECLNRRALVIGVGSIGRKIVKLARGLGMNVCGVDIIKKERGLRYVSLESGLKWADVIFCALPLTDTTEKFLSYEKIKNAVRGKYLVNVGRGEILSTEDIKKLLDEALLAGVGLDVFANESAIASQLRSRVKSKETKILLELNSRDNVVFTPHNAFNTVEALEQKSKLTVIAIKHFLNSGVFPKAQSL